MITWCRSSDNGLPAWCHNEIKPWGALGSVSVFCTCQGVICWGQGIDCRILFLKMAHFFHPCNVTLQLFPLQCETYFSTPWISAGSVICFGQSNVAKVILSDFWALASKGLTAAILVLLKSDCHHVKEKLIILPGREKPCKGEPETPAKSPSWGHVNETRHVSESFLGHAASIELLDGCNHKSNPQLSPVRVSEPRANKWLFFFCFFFKFVFIYLFIFGCVGSSFLCEGFLELRQVGATIHRGARASPYRGLSCCGAQAPDAQAQ